LIIIGHLIEAVAGTAQMLRGRPSQSQSHQGFKIGFKERAEVAQPVLLTLRVLNGTSSAGETTHTDRGDALSLPLGQQPLGDDVFGR
jgi:hypothetical protein